MYNYLYDGKPYTDTSTEYLKQLGMDDEGIESLQRDAADDEKQKPDDFIQQRNDYLTNSDWMVLRHNEQTNLLDNINMTEDEYSELLIWRQQLRDMPETLEISTLNIVWPALPDFLETK